MSLLVVSNLNNTSCISLPASVAILFIHPSFAPFSSGLIISYFVISFSIFIISTAGKRWSAVHSTRAEG